MRNRSVFFMAVLLLLSLSLPAYPQSGAEKTMTMMGYEAAENNRVWEENLFFKRVQERTGLSSRFRQYSDLNEYNAQLSGMMTGDPALPDVLFKARLTPAMTIELFESGVLVDLAPYLEAHAPAFYALMQGNDEIRKAVTLPGGAIAVLPYISLVPGQNILWINQSWLEELKLQVPETPDGLRQVLEAFHSKDPNRNGRQDEIPLSFNGPYDLKYLAHAWGLAANDFNVFLSGNKVRFMPLEGQFRDFIRWLAESWDAGLLDQDGFTAMDSLRRQTDAKATNHFGAFFSPLPTNLVPVEWVGQYRAMPPIAYEGRQIYRPIASPVYTGAFAVTSACDDVAGALEWVDTLYTQEGAVLASVGKEGEDYVVDGDGSWRLLNESASQAYLSVSIISTDDSAPGISCEGFQRRFTDPTVRQLMEQTELIAGFAVSPFPPFSLSRAEEAEIAPLQKAIGRYVDESIARFVNGEWDASEEQFLIFAEELDQLGLEDFLAFWQRVYDRGLKDSGV